MVKCHVKTLRFRPLGCRMTVGTRPVNTECVGSVSVKDCHSPPDPPRLARRGKVKRSPPSDPHRSVRILGMSPPPQTRSYAWPRS